MYSRSSTPSSSTRLRKNWFLRSQMEEDPDSSPKSTTSALSSKLKKRAPHLRQHEQTFKIAKLQQQVDGRFRPLFEVVLGLMLSGWSDKEAESKLSRKEKALLATVKKRISEQHNRHDSAARVVLSFVKKFIVREMRDKIKHGNSTNPTNYIKYEEISDKVFFQYYSLKELDEDTNPQSVWGFSGGPTLIWFNNFTVRGTNFKLCDRILELLCHETEPILHFYRQDKIVKNCSKLFTGLPLDDKAAFAQVHSKLRILPKHLGSKQFTSQPKFPLTLPNFKSAIAQTVARLQHLKKTFEDCPDL